MRAFDSYGLRLRNWITAAEQTRPGLLCQQESEKNHPTQTAPLAVTKASVKSGLYELLLQRCNLIDVSITAEESSALSRQPI